MVVTGVFVLCNSNGIICYLSNARKQQITADQQQIQSGNLTMKAQIKHIHDL